MSQLSEELEYPIRLNRTIIGLKAVYRKPMGKFLSRLNRTIIGLKVQEYSMASDYAFGLNRTIIGLKEDISPDSL